MPICSTPLSLRTEFIEIYCDQGREEAGRWLSDNHGPIGADELEHRLSRYGLNPCGEILGADFHCNLAEVHLNQIDPQRSRKVRPMPSVQVPCQWLAC